MTRAMPQDLRQVSGLIVQLREMGVSVRNIAKLIGWSKSRLHRYLPAFEAIVAEDRLSQMGQNEQQEGANLRVISGGLSQTGQDAA